MLPITQPTPKEENQKISVDRAHAYWHDGSDAVMASWVMILMRREERIGGKRMGDSWCLSYAKTEEIHGIDDNNPRVRA